MHDGNGFDRYGINQYTKEKYDRNGFDRDGFHKDAKTKYDSNDFDRNGFHKDTKSKYDSNDFDIYIYSRNKDTESIHDRSGFDRYGINQYTKTKYDSNGFDGDGFHKDRGIFLNKKNINWLKDEDEFLKLYNEIIKNGEFSEKINKKNNSSYEFKKFMENILNGKVIDNKIIKKKNNN